MPPEPLKVGDIVRTRTLQTYHSVEVPVGTIGVVVRFNERALAWPYTVAFQHIPYPDDQDWLYAESELELVVDYGSDGDAAGSDPVNHPSHYTSHPSGVECIQITEHMDFLTGNAVKYLWRTGKKGPAVEDLKKARWYLDRAIQKAEKGAEG